MSLPRQGQAAVDTDAALQSLGRGLVNESRRLQPDQQAVGEAKLSEADGGVVSAAANTIWSVDGGCVCLPPKSVAVSWSLVQTEPERHCSESWFV